MPEAAKLTPEEEKAIATIRASSKGAVEGSREDAGAVGSGLLNALDTATLGAVPALDDFLREKGIVSPDKPSVREQLTAGGQLHPYASFAGRAGGTILPFTAAARVAQAGLGAGRLAAGALGSGGANVADQAVRAQTEDRDFSPGEAALSTAIGGAGAAAFHPIAALGGGARNAVMSRILGPATTAIEKELPEAGRAAASTVLDDAAAAGAKFRAEQALPKPQAGLDVRPPGPGPLRTPPPDPLRPRTFEGGGGRPFGETTPPPTTPPPRVPDLGPPGSAGPPPGLPFAGVRPGKLEQGSPLWEELVGRIRGEPPTPAAPVALPAPELPLPPLPSGPPGLLDLPLGKIGLAAAATAGEDTRKNRIEENKRRRKRGLGPID